MADREPDVIERMVIHHWNTLFHESGPSWANVTSEKCRQQQTDAMLAAVRELVGAIQHDKRFVGMTCQLMELIEDHERRSEGKGE